MTKLVYRKVNVRFKLLELKDVIAFHKVVKSIQRFDFSNLIGQIVEIILRFDLSNPIGRSQFYTSSDSGHRGEW